jgi:hypothetical protein
LNGVTIEQVVVASEHRYAALPAELAGSLVLAVADAMTSLSLKVGLGELVLLEDGTVRVRGGIPTDEMSAEQSLRLLLDRALLSSSSVTPSLFKAARRPCQGKVTNLVRELEVALIPTNRGAARRALARLCREVSQALRQNPNLQQAVEALLLADTAAVEVEVVESQAPEAASIEPAAAAEYSVALSLSPVPMTLLEAEPIDEWVEISPVFPDVVPATAQRDRIPQSVGKYASIDIPDLEVPIAGKQYEQPQESVWQPVEHTQKLTPVQYSKTPIVDIKVAPAPPLDIAPPAITPKPACAAKLAPPPTITPPPALVAEPEVVELSDDDLHEVTAELTVSSAAQSPPRLLDDSSSTADEFTASVEHQTAEPFLLVVPTLEQNTEHDTTVAEVDGPRLSEASAAEAVEPYTDESQDTVLDVATFVDEEKPAVVASCVDERNPAVVAVDDEISLSEFDSVSEYDLPEIGPLPSEPIVATIAEQPPKAPTQILGPHSYAAPARFSRTPANVRDRIAQFSVAQIPSPNELTHGLRHLAGVEHEPTADPSATPPPTVYAAEEVGCDHPAPKGVLVRTLIGLGTTGLLVVVTVSTGRIANVSAAATGAPIAASRSSCRAILKIDEIPLGTTLHVSQNGQRPRSEILQVNQLPFQIDGLSCGEPAELLVKLSDHGWYRIPIEGSRLSAFENSEPVRIATYLKSR